MAYEVTLNKQGQVLGRKGQETRRNLMAATRRLLCTSSPVDITAVAIAKVAGTSSASFYMYFDDVQDFVPTSRHQFFRRGRPALDAEGQAQAEAIFNEDTA